MSKYPNVDTYHSDFIVPQGSIGCICDYYKLDSGVGGVTKALSELRYIMFVNFIRC